MRVLLGLLLMAPAAAHICLFEPQQRLGTAQWINPGSHQCFRRTPYCGETTPEEPSVTYHAGRSARVVFQQNLNHWYPARPGFMDVAIANLSDTSFSLARRAS